MEFAPTLLLLGNLSPGEIIFIVLLLVLLFGANKIPDLARSLGRAQREFQRARDEAARETVPEARPPTEEEKVRRAAKELGIVTEGKTVDELRLLIADRLKPAA